MKRRDLILASAGILIPAIGRGAQPCPPPQVSVTGGTSVSTNCNIVSSGTSYSTNFPGVENPLSEGGKWVCGQATGLDWNNPVSAGGKTYAAVQAVSPTRYSDDVAHISPSFLAFTPNQAAQATVFKVAGYAGNGGGHEIECLLRFSITPHSAAGYEILWGIQGYLAIVRWNGPVGNYTPLLDPGLGSAPVPNDGDVMRAEIVGNVITVKINGNTVGTASDSTYGSGQPGFGFWPVDGAIVSSLGLKSWTGTNL